MLLNISFHFDYFPLLVVAAIAWGTPILLTLFKLKKIPSVIFEILFGYFIGKFLLQDIDHESMRILEYFALTGFIFLMFLGGLEIDVDQILASLPASDFHTNNLFKIRCSSGWFIFSLLSFSPIQALCC